MKIVNCKINGIENPIGFSYDSLMCSWNVLDTDSKRQKYVKIEVSNSNDFAEIIYSKEGKELNQAGEHLELTLEPRTTYYYRIYVQGEAGDKGVSDTMFFETGKMQEKWNAQWIGPQREDTFHPTLMKEFQVVKPVKKARLYITGVGLFEVFLNGAKVGDEFLTPYLSHYETNLQVITFDISKILQAENSLYIHLGKGWYMGTFGLEQKKENYGNRMAAIGELYVEFWDGSTSCISTDESWNYVGSDIEESGIYFGEVLNRMKWWDKENPKKPVEVLDNPEGESGTKNLVKEHLADRLSIPVKVKEHIAVKQILSTPRNEVVLDMGQNFTGYVEFIADFPRGTMITLDFGEILQEGDFYNGNYAEAQSQFIYISNGQREIVRPHFTFFGFRYVRVNGWPGTCQKQDFIGQVLYSDLCRTGYLETGNEKLNRLYENTVWGLKSNFLDIPTDCPQRSERLGWTGDAQVFAPTACYHMDTRAFFHKFMKDLKDEQRYLEGGVPNYFPNIGHKKDVGSVWGDIAALLPNTLFWIYGNRMEMEYAYPLMKEWVDYIDREDGKQREKSYLHRFGFHFGDWLALDGATPTSFKGSTDDTFIASVYYYKSVTIVREMSERLGKQKEVKRYAELEEKICSAIWQEFFTPTGRLAIDTQAAYVITIKFNIAPYREKVIQQFKIRLKKDCYQIKCGFVGAPLLCTALAEVGLYELAYDFLLKEGFPGWMYSVDLGATTVWERWNSVLPDGRISNTGMNSLNHYAYGSVMEFVYAYAAGIRPKEPGFKKAIIEPHPDIRLKRLKCRYESVNGWYCCDWKITKDGKIDIHIEIPFGCQAEIRLPGFESGSLYKESGSYEFSYVPYRDYRKPFHRETTLARLGKDEKVMEILKENIPMVAGMILSGDPEALADTLQDISQKTYLPIDSKKLEKTIKELEIQEVELE